MYYIMQYIIYVWAKIIYEKADVINLNVLQLY